MPPLTSMLTQAQLMDVLRYEPDTGEFYWLIKPSPRVYAGDRAGCTSVKGYRYIKVNGKSCQAHRLAWLYVYGEWPKLDLDFINRDTLDNRIENLREATKAQNAFNSASRRDNKLKGAYWHKHRKRWTASLQRNGKHIWLGLFKSEEDAHNAYCEAARKRDGEFFCAG